VSLNIDKLKERVAVRFSDIQQVDDSIIRFTKKAGQEPYAVYYIDIAKDLPGTQEKLSKYQDRVIGPYYFEGRRSLQWSNYLYFVTSRDCLSKRDVLRAKELIELDRSYARKYVISEEELDSILSPLKVIPSGTAPHDSIRSIWIDRLVTAGIDKAILSEENMPTRLKLIESSSIAPALVSKPTKHKVPDKEELFIKSLDLNKYLEYPLQRYFEFGTVNLIFGPNGSGKTSLLEAIELFYCGRNKRNPGASTFYNLFVEFVGGKKETVTTHRTASLFRNRNLRWYGQTEIKTNNLYQSFAQFNFLDTDAAVSMAESTSNLKDDLSKLLVGPDAAKTWHNIKKVHEALSSELRSLRALILEIEEEIAALEKQIKSVSNIHPESDSIYTRLCEMIRRINWRVMQGDKSSFASRIVESLSELIALLQQTTELKWIKSPISISILANYCHNTRVAIEKAKPVISQLKHLTKNQIENIGSIERDREALALLEQAKRLIDADVPMRVEEQKKQEIIISTYTGWLVGFDDLVTDVIMTEDLDIPLVKYHEAAVTNRSNAESLLIKQKSGYDKFNKAQDEALNLSQELRQIANKLLKIRPKADRCPLCHTQFKIGELGKHMIVGVDEHLEALGQSFLSQMREQEDVVRKAIDVESLLTWLKRYCERANLSDNISIRVALSDVEKAKLTLAVAQSNFNRLNKEMRLLESQGFPIVMMDDISARLRDIGYSLTGFTREAIELLHVQIEHHMVTIEENNKKIHELYQEINIILGPEVHDYKDVAFLLHELKERLVTTERIQEKLVDFISLFPWLHDRPLGELLVEASSVRQVAAELQTSLSKEKQLNVSVTDALKRKELLELKLSKLRHRQERLDKAYIVLQNLQSEHSLEAAMKSALQENRDSIEYIFSRIHSPAEFRGIGSYWTSLIRRDGNECSLSQISTGQRSAFALAIFLSQNAQLKKAPPVILIDDPIAHIDDLNSLSFIDYLRELVLINNRQIFFATASDKLATLFERKFDFLGEKDFRRFNLRREA
jgi:recombinational DNA repair ATPase RecF